MKIPPDQVDIVCHECKDSNTLQEVNEGACDYFNETGTGCRFPKDGVTVEQIQKIKAINWTCEICKEDQDDKNR